MKKPLGSGKMVLIELSSATIACLIFIGALYYATMKPEKAEQPHNCPMPVKMHSVKCPPPHTVTTRSVSCLHIVRKDLCKIEDYQ